MFFGGYVDLDEKEVWLISKRLFRGGYDLYWQIPSYRKYDVCRTNLEFAYGVVSEVRREVLFRNSSA